MRHTALASLLAIVACRVQTPEPPHVEVITVADAGASACARACETLAKLACPEAETQDGGLSCVALCDKAEASGRFTLNPECVANKKDRESLKACKSVRCGER